MHLTVYSETYQKRRPLSSLNKLGIRKYSTSRIKWDPQGGGVGEASNFYEWLAGFIYGEGCFMIETRGHFLNFTFRITLHKDDLGTLHYIKNTLGVIGNVKIYGNTARFTVTSQQDIAKIIDIFSKYPLNTIKLLNFLDFKRAFELYTSSNNKTKELIQEIANIKSGMNSQRTDFQMPEGHKPRITPYWLLGFVEGEGSFKRGNILTQSPKDLALMEAIKDFFYNLPGVDRQTMSKSLIGVYVHQNSTIKTPITRLIITNTDFIKFLIINFVCVGLSKTFLKYPVLEVYQPFIGSFI